MAAEQRGRGVTANFEHRLQAVINRTRSRETEARIELQQKDHTLQQATAHELQAMQSVEEKEREAQLLAAGEAHASMAVGHLQREAAVRHLVPKC